MPEKQQRGMNHIIHRWPGQDLGATAAFVWRQEQIVAQCVIRQAPAKGTFFMVIAMLDTVDFYEKQIKECSAQAARAANKADREFWQCLADRWAHVLQAENFYGGPDLETVRNLRPSRFSTKRRAA